MKTKQIKIKTKDREATEERLLLAAEQVFSKFGFKGATTRLIATKANINVALINRYFDGKYGLLLKVIERKTLHMHATLLPYPPQKTLTEECLAFSNHRFDICYEDINFLKIVIAQFLTDSKFLKIFQERLLLLETYKDFETRIKKLIEDKKMLECASIESLFEDIETYVFGLIIGKIIIKGFPEKDIKEDLKKFIITYCKSLEKK
jgi:AcrR family transcriptional regulator